jgi:biopolymer transport protein ExbD
LGLRKRRSQLPAFALIAAPVLAALVAADTRYFAPREPTGLELKLARSCPENYATDQVTVLHIAAAGKLFFNAEQEDWNGLGGRVSEVYKVRTQRTLDLVADDGVPFQTVVDALDIVENIPVTQESHVAGREMKKPDITVRLLTPRVLAARCPQSVVGGSSKRALR